jgi:small subunit ribosomal protein S4
VGSRIDTEKELKRAYGLRNKKEAWRMDTTLKRYKDRAKKLLAQSGNQAMVEQQQLLERMARLGLIPKGASFDDVLGLPIEAVMDRRLQTVLIKKNLARTPKQARQMITHRHVTVDGKVVTSPGKLVTLDEERTIGFATRSGFVNDAHPERFSEEELLKKKQKEDAKAGKDVAKEGDEAITFDEKAIEAAEVLAGEKKVDSVKDVVKEEKQEKEAPATKPAPEKPAPNKEDAPKAPKKEEPKAEKPEEKKAEPKPEEKPKEEPKKEDA